MIKHFVYLEANWALSPFERHVLEDLKHTRGLPRRFRSHNGRRFLEQLGRQRAATAPGRPQVLFRSYILFNPLHNGRKFRVDGSNN